MVLNAIGSSELQDGKYLYSPATGRIEVHWIQGIGSASAPAPQARLMATVINGILSRKLPWGLVLLGVSLVIAVELLGIRSLTFAVGAYLPIGTTLPIFVGGVVRWLVDQAAKKSRRGDGGGERYFAGLAVCFGIDCRGRHRGTVRRGAEGLEATYFDNRDMLNLPHTFLDQQLCVGAGVFGAGVFAVLLCAEAAEEVARRLLFFSGQIQGRRNPRARFRGSGIFFELRFGLRARCLKSRPKKALREDLQ